MSLEQITVRLCCISWQCLLRFRYAESEPVCDVCRSSGSSCLQYKKRFPLLPVSQSVLIMNHFSTPAQSLCHKYLRSLFHSDTNMLHLLIRHDLLFFQYMTYKNIDDKIYKISCSAFMFSMTSHARTDLGNLPPLH